MGGTTEDGGETGERGDETTAGGDRCDEARGATKGAETARGGGDETTRGGAHADAEPAPPAAASNCSLGGYGVRVDGRRRRPDAGDGSPAPSTHHCEHLLTGWTGC